MVTVTLPGELRQMARSHQRLFYGLLMSCSAASLQTLGWDSRFVGGQMAMMGVLHTWGRDLSYHPHVHIIVAGGGLWADEGLWLAARSDFLMPVKALSKIVAGKFRDGLKKQAPQLYNLIDPSVWCGPWVVHCQPVGKGQAALKYLATYIFRPAHLQRAPAVAGGWDRTLPLPGLANQTMGHMPPGSDRIYPSLPATCAPPRVCQSPLLRAIWPSPPPASQPASPETWPFCPQRCH